MNFVVVPFENFDSIYGHLLYHSILTHKYFSNLWSTNTTAYCPITCILMQSACKHGEGSVCSVMHEID